MIEALETELDRLFQLPPAALVEARNELADRLRKAGDKAAAARVKSLKRPTPAAWALNQVHFAQPGLLQQARTATATLRALHARDGVDRLQLSAAVEAQRIAVRAVVEAAMQRCHAAGLTGGAPLSRRLLLTLQAWLAGASSELPGRMTQDVEPSGFEAIADVGGSPSGEQLAIPALDMGSAPVSRPAPPSAAKPRGPDPRALAQANAELEASEKLAQTAREHTTRRRIEQDRARAELERASVRVRELEQTLASLQDQQRKRAAEFERADRAATEAEQQQRDADQSVIIARERVAELKRAR